MSEPRRFLEDGGGLEQSLLRSAREDAPQPGSRQRTLAALGLGVGVSVLGASATTAATAKAATATATATATAAATATPAVKVAATIGMLKWIGVGVASGALLVGAAEVAHSVSPPPAKVAPTSIEDHARAAIPAPRPAAKGVAPAPMEAPEVPAPAVTEAPVVAAPVASEAASAGAPSVEAPRARSASPTPAPSALADEIAALDSAREALASGDAGRALRALDARDRAFPRGALGPEAMVLRIEALALRGDRAAATRLGESFLAASPRSPHASRIRTLLNLDLDLDLAAPAPEAAP
jgi:hypothetical protein